MTTKTKSTATPKGRGNKARKTLSTATSEPAVKAKATTNAMRTAKSNTGSATSVTNETMCQMAAAERVLAEVGEPLNSQAMVKAMSVNGYWSSPGGKTPAATLYASLLRHIQKHGKAARLVKTDRGLFTLAGK
jgi:exosome complex RNA-binding protein Csl4